MSTFCVLLTLALEIRVGSSSITLFVGKREETTVQVFGRGVVVLNNVGLTERIQTLKELSVAQQKEP